MKNRLVTAAVLAALGSAAANAAVLPPTTPIDFTLYAGGGSAQVNSVYVAATKLLSNPTIYSTGACGTPAGNYLIVLGNATAALNTSAPTIAVGKNVLFFYKFNGGSGPNGVTPQGLPVTNIGSPVHASNVLPYPTNTQLATATACAGTIVPNNPNFVFAIGTTANQIPDWGLSDLEPSVLNAADNIAVGGAPLTSAQVTSITKTGTYDNIFGVAVTNNVYAGTPAKTSFTKAEVAGILAGSITDWSQLFGDPNSSGAALPAGPIVLLDRGLGSGSKASGSAYFLSYPNVPGGLHSLLASNAGVGTSTTVTCSGDVEDVAEGSSGAIVTDLRTAQNHAPAGSCRAIAILGAEFPPALATTQPAGYSFAKINGFGIDSAQGINGSTSTNYDNTILGTYDFVVTNSFNNRTKVPGHFPADGTANGQAITAFKTQLQSNTLPGGVNGVGYPTAVPGVLLDPTVDPSATKCVVYGSHAGATLSPIIPVLDATVGAPGACNDPL
jgi:hypothetical protein